MAVQAIAAILSSLFFIPLSYLFPKKRERIVVIGRQNGLFSDNAKHFYLFLCQKAQPHPDVTYLVFNTRTYNLLADAGLPVCFYPSLKSILFLLTANIVVVDSAEWIARGVFQLTFRSRVVQLWHGAPLKQIEIPLFLKRISGYPAPIRAFMKAYKLITGRHAECELVVTTSDFFTDKAFRPAFRAKHFLDAGYPRNDSLDADIHSQQGNAALYFNTDVASIKTIIARKAQGARILLYAPTFRKECGDPFPPAFFDLKRLDTHASQHNLLFVLKLHPILSALAPKSEYSNILIYNATADIYPALNLFDTLITDYSSIYFDFLLLDRPIIFYPYDYDSFIKYDRSLLFDYDQMAPGLICRSLNELEKALVLPVDPIKAKRREILNLVFTHQDYGASARIYRYLTDNYIA